MCLRKSMRISTSPLPAGIIELNEVRRHLLTVFGIWIHLLSGLEQREVFGAKFFLQFVYLLGQLSSFLAVFLLVGLVELITEIEDLAIGLGFSLIATDDADNLLCQFGSIGLLSLSKQRRRRNNQNPQHQQPVHGFPLYRVKRSFQRQRVSSLKSLEHRFPPPWSVAGIIAAVPSYP